MENAVLVATGEPRAWRWVEKVETDPPMQVAYAVGGQAALRDVARGGWRAVVVVDDLDGVSGLAILKAARELHRELPVVFVATRPDERMEIAVRRQGVHYYAVAPVSHPLLAQVLRKLIEHETKKLFWQDGRAIRMAF